MKHFIQSAILGLCVGGLIACASTTKPGAIGIERKQFLQGTDEKQVNDMSAKGYADMVNEARGKGLLDKNPAQVARVKAIVQKLIAQTKTFRDDVGGWQWETHVITSDDVNAFCMPGGKMIIFTGIIDKLQMTDAEIAAVMGHEISHALREHGRERLAEEAVKQGALGVAMSTGYLDSKYAQAAAQVTAQLLSMRYGRKQELEADAMGVELMARAGYDPKEAVSLWQKMNKAAGGKAPPEFMSTHPSSDRRIADIQGMLPKVEPLYQQTR